MVAVSDNPAHVQTLAIISASGELYRALMEILTALDGRPYAVPETFIENAEAALKAHRRALGLSA